MSNSDKGGDADLTTLFIGNISYETTNQDIEKLFEDYGEVSEVRIATDPTGRSKGFAFVKMPNADEANKAIKGLVGTRINDREIRVELSEKKNRDGRD
eukprot:gene23572-30564_t